MRDTKSQEPVVMDDSPSPHDLHTTYIYTMADPLTPGVIRYVGKTTQALNRRLSMHCRDKAKSHKASWVMFLAKSGRKPVITEIEVVVSTDQRAASDAEKKWIAHYKEIGCKLVNLTDGGEGICGYKHTPDTKARISLTCQKNMTPERRAKLATINLGRHPSPETILKLSYSNKKRWEDPKNREQASLRCIGRRVTPDAKIKMSAAKVGRRLSEEHRAKIGLAGIGRPCSEETRAKRSVNTKRQMGSPEARAELSLKAKKRWEDPEFRARVTVKFKKKWENAEYRAKMFAVNKGRLFSPETRAKMSAAAKRRWHKDTVVAPAAGVATQEPQPALVS